MSGAAARRDGGEAAVTGGFFLCGIFTVLLGPVIPELQATWGVEPAAAARLFVAQFVASSIGAVIAGYRLRYSLVGGYALVAAGLAALALGGWPLATPSLALVGLGLGLLIPASNLYVAHRHPERRVAALSTLNFVWGAGAVSCPLLFAMLRGKLALTATLMLLAALAAAAAAALRLSSAGSVAEPAPAHGRAARDDAGLGLLSLMAGMLFLYVGAESAVGGWLVTLADQVAGQRTVVSLLIGSGFWAAILAGRALAPRLLRRISEGSLYRLCLALALAGTLLLALSSSRAALAGGALAAGLGMAALYPLTVSILAAATAASHSRATGWVLACGGLGGAALPWLTGTVAGDAAAPARAFLVPLAALALLAGLRSVQRAVGR